MARKIYDGLGGQDNLINFDYCATRVRVELKDSDLVNKQKIMEAGITNVLINGKHNVQVIVGPKVQFVVDAMDEIHHNEKKKDKLPLD